MDLTRCRARDNAESTTEKAPTTTVFKDVVGGKRMTKATCVCCHTPRRMLGLGGGRKGVCLKRSLAESDVVGLGGVAMNKLRYEEGWVPIPIVQAVTLQQAVVHHPAFQAKLNVSASQVNKAMRVLHLHNSK